jgi:hypothetical protein
MNEPIFKATIKCQISIIYNAIAVILLCIGGLNFINFLVGNGYQWELETKRNVGISSIVVYIILVGIRFYWQDIAKASSLELTEEGISGSLKIWGVNSKLNIPLDNISSLYVKESIWDKIRSGKTLVIASSSGSVKFRCVQNADEFVENVNNLTEKRKNATKAPSSAANQVSSADELKKFKELLDAGAISQEEYDSKKKQLLGL